MIMRYERKKQDISMIIESKSFEPFGRVLSELGVDIEPIEINNNKQLLIAVEGINRSSHADDRYAVRSSLTDDQITESLPKSLYNATPRLTGAKLELLMRAGFMPVMIMQTIMTPSELDALNIACQVEESA